MVSGLQGRACTGLEYRIHDVSVLGLAPGLAQKNLRFGGSVCNM